MTLRQESIHHMAATIAPPLEMAPVSEWMLTSRERRMIDGLPGNSGMLARTIIPLNVMGGIAESAGALLLHAALAETVTAAVRRNSPGQVLINWYDSDGQNSAPPFVVAINELRSADGLFLPAIDIIERFGRKLNRPGLALLGAWVEAVREGLIPVGEDGWSLGGVGSPGLSTLSALKAPLVTAVLHAAAALHGVPLIACRVAAVAVVVQHDWLGWPLGVGDAHAATSGKVGGLQQFRSDLQKCAGTVELPPTLEVIAIDCGTESADARLTNQHVRAAAAMGRVLVRRIMEHDQLDLGTWNGHLSGLSMTDYVERFRDRLPMKMKGKEFLERFGDPGDPYAPIKPEWLYKVRSRTEHMIYEHARATHFAEFISRGVRKSDPQAYVDAGELMYASHWSYGQRCGLGGVETDYIVSQLRSAGKDNDILGAKICGRGCGGMVAVLKRVTPKAEQALADACGTYQLQMNRLPRVLRQAASDRKDLELQPI